MSKTSLTALALAALLSVPAWAQSPAPAATAKPAAAAAVTDQVVQGRAEANAARSVYNQGKKAAQADRNAKVAAAVEAAEKDPANKGKDALVVKREAKAKAMAATKGDYEAKMKALTAERKTAVDAADKKIKAAKRAA